MQLSMFRLLPARPLSRTWGSLASSELPLWLRRPVLGLYVWAFGCQMSEAVEEDVGSYQSLVQLFTRQLKHGVRPVSDLHDLVCKWQYICDKSEEDLRSNMHSFATYSISYFFP